MFRFSFKDLARSVVDTKDDSHRAQFATTNRRAGISLAGHRPHRPIGREAGDTLI
jgi:hypothetical protein